MRAPETLTTVLQRAPETLSTTVKRAPDWDSFHLQIFSAKTTFTSTMSSAVGSQYGAITAAAESLIAQLYSQGKLTTLRCKNKTKSTRKLNFKSK
jgi:hypothetical protein